MSTANTTGYSTGATPPTHKPPISKSDPKQTFNIDDLFEPKPRQYSEADRLADQIHRTHISEGKEGN